VLGSKAYFAGGRYGDNLLSLVEIYDAVSGEWDSSHELSQARMLPAGVACGSKVLFAGGLNLTGPPYEAFDEVDIFDTLTQEWTVAYLSVARLVGAVSHENIVLFAGGGTIVPWAAYKIVDIYNVETGDWDTAELSEARDARSAAVVGNLAVFAGGNSDGVVSNTVDIYNFTTGIWSVDTLSVPRDRIQAVAINDKILFAGGMTANNQRSDLVEIFDATNGTWSIDTLSFPRAFSNNTCGDKACDKAFFAGGGNLDLNTLSWNDVYDNIDIYEEATDTWTQDNLNIARIEHVVVGVGNQLVVTGGYNSSWQQISSVEIFTCPETSCLSEGITFTTQEQIDSFQANYPGCTEIEGDVVIYGGDIINLDGLSVITSIQGNFNIGSRCGSGTYTSSALHSFSGLDNLVSIGGGMGIQHCFVLKDFTGLESLTSIGAGLYFGCNDSLTSLTGLQNLKNVGWISIGGNPALRSLTGMDSLTAIGGSLQFGTPLFGGNPSLTDLSGLENITSIGGSLWILVNDSLTSLSGLENLTVITGELKIGSDIWGGNPSLSNLAGLDNITSIGGDLWIQDNDSLNNINDLGNLTSIAGDIMIGGYNSYHGNPSLVSLSGLDNIEAGTIENIIVSNNNLLSECNIQSICDYLVAPNGTVEIHDNAPGCNNLPEIAQACGITMPCLPYGLYYFFTQNEIDNFQFNYPGCSHLEGDVLISGDDITNLNGLGVVNSFEESLTIDNNPLLSNITGLINVTSIGGNFSVISNPVLTSLSGLENVDPGSIDDLSIWSNTSLSICNIQSICEYLASPGGNVSFYNNAYGCHSQQYVEDACESQCLYDGITFTTQAEIDNFQSNYPGCAKIEGVVEICGTDITNLYGLIGVSEIGGDLWIHDNPILNCLAGLDNIIASSVSNLYIYNNNSLSSCDVTSICLYLASPGGTIDIHDNAAGCNSQLEVQVSCESHCLYDGIIFSTQEEIDDFQNNHPDCGIIEGDVRIKGDDISNLDGLSVISAIGGYLKIWENPALTNFDGLSNLISIGGYLKVYTNNSLADISGLEALTYIDGYLYINSNDALTSLTGLENIEAGSIEELTIRYNDALSTCHAHSICQYLIAPNATSTIEGNAPGCNSAEEIIDLCWVSVGESQNGERFSIFPNPFTNSTTLEIKLHEPGRVEVKIYNQIGQLLKTIARDYQNAGLLKIDLETGDLEPGIYFCVVKSREKIRTVKMIKL